MSEETEEQIMRICRKVTADPKLEELSYQGSILTGLHKVAILGKKLSKWNKKGMIRLNPSVRDIASCSSEVLN